MTPEPDRTVGNRVGVFALLVGIAAVIVGQTYRFDLVRGGTYLEDPWPDVFRIVGAVLIVLGLAMLLVRREQQENLMTLTALLAIATALVGGVMLTGLSNDQSATTTTERNSEAIDEEPVEDPAGTGKEDPPSGSTSRQQTPAALEAARLADQGAHVVKCEGANNVTCFDEANRTVDAPADGEECAVEDAVGQWVRISDQDAPAQVFFHCVLE